MLTVLTGSNAYSIKTELNKLISDFTAKHGDLALERLDGEEHSYEQILGAVESLPFLSDKKMVVVQEISANKQATEQLDHLIEGAGDTTDLIIVEPNLDKRVAYYKQLKKLNGFREHNEMDDSQLVNWLVEAAKKAAGSLTRSDALYLVQRVGGGQMRLSRELQKLLVYEPEINRETIDLLTEESPSSTIFNLIDTAFSGNLQQALALYDEQRKQKIEPQAIHGMMVWQMHAVAVTAAAPRNLMAAQIAKDSGISPYTIQKSQRIARSMDRAKIIEIMALLRDIDYRGKHEALDYDESLRYVIVRLAD